MKNVFFLIFLLFVLNDGYAAKLTGGEITYEHIGTSAQPFLYKIKLSLYRQIEPGTTPDSIAQVTIRSTCFGTQMLNLTRILPPPSSAAGDGGFVLNHPYQCVNASDTNLISMSVHRFEDTITLPGKCYDYRFSYSGCCRDTSLSNITSPTNNTLYLEATLINTLRPNNSVYFTNDPLVNVCMNNMVRLSYSCKDADGDSLYYQLVSPATSDSSSLSWAQGYSGYRPVQNVNGFALNSRYGIMEFDPAIVERDVLVVMVTEYTFDPTFQLLFKISEVRREAVLNIVQSCKSTPAGRAFLSNPQNVDTSAVFMCNDSIIKLKMSQELLVSKIDGDGSNFRLTDLKTNLPVPVIEAIPKNVFYGGLLTHEVWLKTYNPFVANDSLLLYIKRGLSGDYLTTPCNEALMHDSVYVTGKCKNYFGVPEKNNPQAISVFPNPVTDRLTILLNDIPQPVASIRLYDATGRLVGQHPIPAGQKEVQINFANFQRGVYFARLYSEVQIGSAIRILK